MIKWPGLFCLIGILLILLLVSCSSPPLQVTPPGITPTSGTSATESSTESLSVQPIQISKDIVYASHLDPVEPEPDLLLDVYQPSGGVKTSPVVVFLHGLNAVKEAHESESRAMAERGAVVFTINWPTPNTDLAWKDNGENFRMMAEAHACAIRFARARAPDYGGDPKRVILVAFSMGARIGITAALAGDDLPVLWEEFAATRGGPSSQIECVEGEESASVDAFVGIGGRYKSVNYLENLDPELWDIVSPFAHIGRNPTQRIRLILGEQDSNVSSENQAEFNQLLLDAGYDSQLILWDGRHLVPVELTADTVIEAARE